MEVINLLSHKSKFTFAPSLLKPTGLFKHFEHFLFIMDMMLRNGNRRWWWKMAGGMEKLLFECTAFCLSFCLLHDPSGVWMYVCVKGHPGCPVLAMCSERQTFGDLTDLARLGDDDTAIALLTWIMPDSGLLTRLVPQLPLHAHPPASAHLCHGGLSSEQPLHLQAALSPSSKRSDTSFGEHISFLSYYHKIPQSGWLKTKETSDLTIPEA